jgi:hypothetical protein
MGDEDDAATVANCQGRARRPAARLGRHRQTHLLGSEQVDERVRERTVQAAAPRRHDSGIACTFP